MKSKLNLCELLKDSIGETFWTYCYGEVILHEILSDERKIKFICKQTSLISKQEVVTNQYGEFDFRGGTGFVFPSKENCNWQNYVER